MNSLAGFLLAANALVGFCSNPLQVDVRLTKLANPMYPPLARQARIAGDVELALEIRTDGTVQSATVVKGHALLAQSALDSARHSQFECRNCTETEAVQLVYTFQLVEQENCFVTSASLPNSTARGGLA